MVMFFFPCLFFINILFISCFLLFIMDVNLWFFIIYIITSFILFLFFFYIVLSFVNVGNDYIFLNGFFVNLNKIFFSFLFSEWCGYLFFFLYYYDNVFESFNSYSFIILSNSGLFPFFLDFTLLFFCVMGLGFDFYFFLSFLYLLYLFFSKIFFIILFLNFSWNNTFIYFILFFNFLFFIYFLIFIFFSFVNKFYTILFISVVFGNFLFIFFMLYFSIFYVVYYLFIYLLILSFILKDSVLISGGSGSNLYIYILFLNSPICFVYWVNVFIFIYFTFNFFYLIFLVLLSSLILIIVVSNYFYCFNSQGIFYSSNYKCISSVNFVFIMIFFMFLFSLLII